MTYLDARFWSSHFREVFIEENRWFIEAALARIVTGFDHVEEESKEVLQSELKKRQVGMTEDDDPLMLGRGPGMQVSNTT